MITSFKAEVTTAGDNGAYTSNAVRFATADEAKRYGTDLQWRWTAVRGLRVTGSDEPVNAHWDDKGLTHH